MKTRVLLSVLGAALLAIGTASARANGPAWTRGVYDGRSGEALEWSALQTRIETADILLLGEVHDNPAHHSAQALAMEWRFANSDTRPTVVFEMLHRGQRPTLDAFTGTASQFPEAMQWKERGWPDAAMYAPVFERMFQVGAELVAADLTRSMIDQLYRSGPDTLSSDVRAVFDLLEPLPEDLQSEMTQLQFEAHCELMPREQMGTMVMVQRARDAALAEAVLTTMRAQGAPVVLIAGAGHVRNDHGVGLLLRRALPEADILSIGLTEPERYTDIAESQFDIVWVTNSAVRPDPCERLQHWLSNQ